MERGAATWKPNVEISPNCPRCGSSNTKFCYYNNYSLTQPRYFCKGCRRYWTKGGSLRNVPVGGGCRKNRRAKSVRLSNHHHHHGGINPNISRSLSYGGLSYNNSNNSLAESSSTSSGSSPHIDLALVYANFLNQPPDTKTSSGGATAVEMPVSLPNEFDPLPPLILGFSTMGNLEEDNNHNNNGNGINVGSLLPTTAVESHHHLRLDHNNHQGIMYNDVFDSVLVHQKHDDQDGIHHQLCSSNLPPLPSEDIVTHQDHDQMLWLNSHHHHHHTVEAAAQEPMMLAPEAHDPSNLLFGNWSPFDFSSDDTFSKT